MIQCFHTLQNKWGLTQEEEDEEMERRERFVETLIPSTRSQLRVLLESYQVSDYFQLMKTFCSCVEMQNDRRLFYTDDTTEKLC